MNDFDDAPWNVKPAVEPFRPPQKEEDVEVVYDFDEISEADLLEENSKLAVRAINRALKSNKIDSTLVTAAVRAMQMWEEAQAKGAGVDPEDDMLRWVAEVERKKLDGK